MTLSYLTPLFDRILVPEPRQSASSPGLSVAARAPAIAARVQRSNHPVLVLAPQQDVADRLEASIGAFLDEQHPVARWHAPDPLPFEQLPHDVHLSDQRLSLLQMLTRRGSTPCIITTIRALMAYIRLPESLIRDTIQLESGQRVNDQTLVRRLVNSGYRVEAVADYPGLISRRGGIIDVYSPGDAGAVRLEFFGDEVESIRRYDPSTQRSSDRLEWVEILPPIEFDLGPLQGDDSPISQLSLDGLRPEVQEEWESIQARVSVGEVPEAVDLIAAAATENQATLLSYLPASSLIVEIDPPALRLESEQVMIRAAEVRGTLEAAGELPAGLPDPFPDPEALRAEVNDFCLWQLGISESSLPELRTRENFVEPPIYAGNVTAAVKDIRQRLRMGWRIVVASDQSERIGDLLAEADLYPRVSKRGGRGLIEPPPERAIDVVHVNLEQGFGLQDPPLFILTDRELFGIRKTVRPHPSPRKARYRQEHHFEAGDYVVHVDHGVGVFQGLVTLDISGIDREYLQIDYADSDRLYVPVDQSDRVTPYETPAGKPKVTRLSSSEWMRTKSRVREAVREMAHELLAIYAQRELAVGTSYPDDVTWDLELAESFPFQETQDQLAAIDDVRADLERASPMDRLVCGDVGYGKTEVALRAAFKVVNGGKQVAVLVPTTVLALQHYETFRERLAAFPVRVEMLSRLRSKAEQRQILSDLREGKIDIVIGTHRLVQRDVQFNDLGLLIVDEEQRFGVRHKEYIKQQRAEIDVLTMTATPIPRTLHMALTGLRDMSLIATPPQERVPVRTFVTARDDTVVREAVLRELQRGGQVYVVHNRVHSIYRTLEWLEELVPEATYGVGHGQMDESELEQVILAFMHHEFDVLLCTTIIESGIDIPNVNTIIIDNAHALGLTQLYQLRGRVGRASSRAYSYLLYPPKTPLSSEARQRLAAIQEATELGSGYQIALRDMEIRGAGNVLGAEQSGHIASIGLNLYTRMLSHAVEELRAGRPILDQEEVNLDIAVDARIPEDYIEDESLRLEMYQRIASAESGAELGDARRELVDRFGDIPVEVDEIFALVRLRHRATDLGVTTVVERDREILIRPIVGARLDERSLHDALGQGVRITPNQIRLRLNDIDATRWEAIDAVFSQLESIKDNLLVHA